MSSFALMNLGRQAASVAYGQLQVAGNNIANANTAGYSRQSAELATQSSSSYSGSGYFGRGVTISTVARAQNMFLSGQLVSATSAAAADGVRSSMLTQLEQVFPGGETGLGASATQIFNAFADVAAAPADLSARQAVLGRLDDFSTLVRNSSQQLASLESSAVHDIRGGVDTVNTLADRLAKLNLRIVAAGSAHAPSDLLDQRDELVRSIGAQLDVQTYVGEDNTVSVFVGMGLSLVRNGTANALVAIEQGGGSGRIAVGLDQGGSVMPIDVEEGEIGGLLRFQREDLAMASGRLNQMAVAVADALNSQQAMGLDLQGRGGQPLLDYAGRGQPVTAAPDRGNARDAGGQFIASVQTMITDASALKGSEYALQVDPANSGQYQVTRLSDGYRYSAVSDGDEIDGFRISIGAAGLDANDRFTLRPLGQAAASLSVALQDPRGVAAANPATAVMAVSNTGTARVTGVAVEAPSASGSYSEFQVHFVGGNGEYEVRDPTGGVLDSGSFVPGEPLRYDGLAMTLSGFPANGDALSVTPVRTPAANNGNALRFDQLSTLPLIDGQTVGDAHANTLADLGVRTQGAAAAAQTSATVSARTRSELSGSVGVNLDEEAARLIQYQQAYQAAAKVMQTAQTLLDTIIGLSR